MRGCLFGPFGLLQTSVPCNTLLLVAFGTDATALRLSHKNDHPHHSNPPLPELTVNILLIPLVSPGVALGTLTATSRECTWLATDKHAPDSPQTCDPQVHFRRSPNTLSAGALSQATKNLCHIHDPSASQVLRRPLDVRSQINGRHTHCRDCLATRAIRPSRSFRSAAASVLRILKLTQRG